MGALFWLSCGIVSIIIGSIIVGQILSFRTGGGCDCLCRSYRCDPCFYLYLYIPCRYIVSLCTGTNTDTIEPREESSTFQNLVQVYHGMERSV